MTNPMTNPANSADDRASEPEPTGAGAVPAPEVDSSSAPLPTEAQPSDPGASPEPIVDPAPADAAEVGGHGTRLTS